MIVQHNMSAMNANRRLGITAQAQAKSTEKLSSGYRINRAADDAAGLSISEKMRSQIRGLNQASVNAQDGISLIQTAEGALNEQHAILHRMRELAVQAANGTETDEDREAVNDEISQLQDELTRIADTTEFNSMTLLDGSLNGTASGTDSGPLFGVVDPNLDGALVSSNVSGVSLSVNSDTKYKHGQETAIWSADGKNLTLNLVDGRVYTQNEIDTLIANAKQEDSTAVGAPAEIKVSLKNGILAANGTMGGTTTEAGIAATSNVGTLPAGSFVGANQISIKSNKYGEEFNGTKFNIVFDEVSGSEEVETITAISYDSINAVTPGEYTIHLAPSKDYTAEDIEKILMEAGFDFDVTLAGATPDEPKTLFAEPGTTTDVPLTLGGGEGLSNQDLMWGQGEDLSDSKGITLQIGANEGQTMTFTIESMTARSLGVDGNKVDLSSQDGASSSINIVDEAIKKVSLVRGRLGAIQNRLEHTIANLDTSSENTQAAESRIRDLDMAKEMVSFSKNNILSQAGQSMLAQANQATQGVLSLLQG